MMDRPTAQAEFARLDAISKRRALSHDESQLLEKAINALDGKRKVYW